MTQAEELAERVAASTFWAPERRILLALLRNDGKIVGRRVLRAQSGRSSDTLALKNLERRGLIDICGNTPGVPVEFELNTETLRAALAAEVQA